MTTLRLKPLLLAALTLSLSACAPKPQPPSQREQGRNRPSAPQPIPEGAATTPQLRKAVEAAADLFNRGENDLACEQVRRAEGLKGSTAPADAALTQQLNDYRQACEPTP